jgi:hypothetical protein
VLERPTMGRTECLVDIPVGDWRTLVLEGPTILLIWRHPAACWLPFLICWPLVCGSQAETMVDGGTSTILHERACIRCLLLLTPIKLDRLTAWCGNASNISWS